jgi:hypothetical protein
MGINDQYLWWMQFPGGQMSMVQDKHTEQIFTLKGWVSHNGSTMSLSLKLNNIYGHQPMVKKVSVDAPFYYIYLYVCVSYTL